MDSRFQTMSPLGHYMDDHDEVEEQYESTNAKLQLEQATADMYKVMTEFRDTMSKMQASMAISPTGSGVLKKEPPVASASASRVLETKSASASSSATIFSLFREIRGVLPAAPKLRISTLHNVKPFDQFRYSAIASNLLAKGQSPMSNRTSFAGPGHRVLISSPENNYTLQGAAVPVLISLAIACALKWSTSAAYGAVLKTFLVIFISLIGVFVLTDCYSYYKQLKAAHESSQNSLDEFIPIASDLEDRMRIALRSIQETEIVASNYIEFDVDTPVSRKEGLLATGRSESFRKLLGDNIAEVKQCFLKSHVAMLSLVDPVDMQRYHDIYEISHQDYQDITQGLSTMPGSEPGTLQNLRIAVTDLVVARRIFLCDLLALRLESSPSDLQQTSRELANLTNTQQQARKSLEALFHDGHDSFWNHARAAQELDPVALERDEPDTPGKDKLKVHFLKIDALAEKMRGLLARTLLLRGDAEQLAHDAGRGVNVEAALARQWHILDSDIKELAAGRGCTSTTTSSPGGGKSPRFVNSARSSYSPRSPRRSLDGTTVTSGGSPSDALRILTSGISTPSKVSSVPTEDIFEGVSRRMTLLTKEERAAKLEADRLKNEALARHRETNSCMMKELESLWEYRTPQPGVGDTLPITWN